MKMKIRKILVLLGIVSALNIWTTGCGTTHEYNTKTQEDEKEEVLSEKLSDTASEENDTDTAKTQENAT